MGTANVKTHEERRAEAATFYALVCAHGPCDHCGVLKDAICQSKQLWPVHKPHASRINAYERSRHDWERSKTVDCPGCGGRGRITRKRRSEVFEKPAGGWPA